MPLIPNYNLEELTQKIKSNIAKRFKLEFKLRNVISISVIGGLLEKFKYITLNSALIDDNWSPKDIKYCIDIKMENAPI